MALLQINADFTRLCEILADIRDILRVAFPPPIPVRTDRKRDHTDIVRLSAEKLHEREMRQRIRHAAEHGEQLTPEELEFVQPGDSFGTLGEDR